MLLLRLYVSLSVFTILPSTHLINPHSSLYLPTNPRISVYPPTNPHQAAGGLISSSLLSFPGASSFYRGGLTLYTLESRKAFIGWTDADTASYKGPTPAIVTKLADNTRRVLGSTYAVSESGTAGPTGGNTRNRTPGYVALAVSREAGTVTREVETGSKEREGNMVRFAVEALTLVRDAIKGTAGEGVKSSGGEEEGVRLVPGDGKTEEAAVGAFAS